MRRKTFEGATAEQHAQANFNAQPFIVRNKSAAVTSLRWRYEEVKKLDCGYFYLLHVQSYNKHLASKLMLRMDSRDRA